MHCIKFVKKVSLISIFDDVIAINRGFREAFNELKLKLFKCRLKYFGLQHFELLKSSVATLWSSVNVVSGRKQLTFDSSTLGRNSLSY